MDIGKRLRESPINYFSDLFVAAMVVVWIAEAVVMTVVGVYATVRLGDTSMWADVGTLAAVPVSVGGGIWMLKNSVQHAIANQRGERAHMDFPAVDDTIDIEGFEQPMAAEADEAECAEADADAEADDGCGCG